jgi:hypothetical protein
MLRLAHRILNSPVGVWSHVPDRGVRDAIGFGEASKATLRNATIIIADDVAEYFWVHDREEWGIREFPNLAPPSSPLFIEWCWKSHFYDVERPYDQSGVLITWDEITDDNRESWIGIFDGFLRNSGDHKDIAENMLRAADSEDARWICAADNWLSLDGIAAFCHAPMFAVISRQGTAIARCGLGTGVDPMSEIDVALLAVGFMHCKNVARRDATETEGPPDKWLRRQKQPKLRYHVLEINPMKEVLRTEGQSETLGLKRALHTCRGHFTHYSEERPLFGRYSGTFWVPEHKRGNVKHGMVLKDYSIGAPPEGSNP